MSPGLARVGGFVDSVTDREIGASQAFTAGNVDGIRIRRSHGDCSNGLRRLIVENGRPGAAGVVCFPDAAVHRADIENIWLARHAARGTGSPAASRTDHAPTKFLVGALGILLRFGGRRGWEYAEQDKRNYRV